MENYENRSNILSGSENNDNTNTSNIAAAAADRISSSLEQQRLLNSINTNTNNNNNLDNVANSMAALYGLTSVSNNNANSNGTMDIQNRIHHHQQQQPNYLINNNINNSNLHQLASTGSRNNNLFAENTMNNNLLNNFDAMDANGAQTQLLQLELKRLEQLRFATMEVLQQQMNQQQNNNSQLNMNGGGDLDQVLLQQLQQQQQQQPQPVSSLLQNILQEQQGASEISNNANGFQQTLLNADTLRQHNLQQQDPATVSHHRASLARSNKFQMSCPARRMSVSHNPRTAYFQLSDDTPHASELICSFAECRNGGVKFLWCSHCKEPVAKRNFRKNHLHCGGKTSPVVSPNKTQQSSKTSNQPAIPTHIVQKSSPRKRGGQPRRCQRSEDDDDDEDDSCSSISDDSNDHHSSSVPEAAKVISTRRRKEVTVNTNKDHSAHINNNDDDDLSANDKSTSLDTHAKDAWVELLLQRPDDHNEQGLREWLKRVYQVSSELV